MQSTLDFSTANADIMSMQLDKIVFSDLTAGDEVDVQMTVYNGDSATELDSWYNAYYADANGKITISDLARMWNSYIVFRRRQAGDEDTAPTTLMGGIKVKISYFINNAETYCYRRIWYSTKRDGMTLATLNGQFPFVNLKKRTFTDAHEGLYIVGPTAQTVSILCTFLSGTTVGSTGYTATASAHDNFGYYYDVSPSEVATHISSGTLKEYRVSVSGNNLRYYIEEGNYAQRTEFSYINRYGVYETLWLVGAETWKPDRSAEFGWAGDDWVGLDVETQDVYELNTGYVNDKVLEQLRDLASSPTAWKWNATTSAWHKIAIKGVDFERIKPSNEVRSGIVTYQYADRNY